MAASVVTNRNSKVTWRTALFEKLPKLHFSLGGNAKLPDFIASFSLPSGHTCPGACDCKSIRDMKTGRVRDFETTKFRCFSASQEVARPNVWKSRLANLKKINSCASLQDKVYALESSLPHMYPYIRIHIGGDFFSQEYFDAWLLVARRNPGQIFYGYTKSLHFWVKRLDKIPSNLLFTASRGGKFDKLIDIYGLREAVVVYHPDEAKRLGLEIDHDDSHAYSSGPSFALLLHGVQPAKSESASALKRLRAEKINYSYKNKK